MNTSLKRGLLQSFSQMIADLKNQKEAETFFKDFFENKELEKYIKRLFTAYWIKKGRDAKNIKNNLKVSAKEILESKKLLKKEGIKLAIKKMEAEEWANQWAERIKNVTRD